MIQSIGNSIAGMLGLAGNSEEQRLMEKRMKMLDELRSSVSSKVWAQFGEYAKNKLDACPNADMLGSVFDELKDKALAEQDQEDATQRAVKSRYEDELTISVTAREQIQARMSAAA